MNNVVEVCGLKKSYNYFALKDVSFCLPQDCITGFIGVNGAGKTTTIRAMLGLTNKDGGSIKIFDKNPEHAENEIKSRIGVVLDEGCFYEELTMAEMKSIIAPSYPKWNEKTYKSYMDRFSLSPKQQIATLSKGMRMKFSLTLALSHEADLLIMDEPTSGLDPMIRNELLEILTTYMQQGGKSVFFSTHITSDLEKSADMLILIHGGEILFAQEKDSLLDSFCRVKGHSLTPETEKLFKSIKKTQFGFEGITQNPQEVQNAISGTLIEKPTIEEIMLAYIGGAVC